MKSFQFVVAALLLVSSAVTLADKPDPELPNPPLQVKEYNVDGDGNIAVHEQGIASVNIVEGVELDVNVTGGQVEVSNTVDVSGEVEVSNFPSEQNVLVNGGELSAVTRVYSNLWDFPEGEYRLHEFTGGPIYATTIHVSDATEETFVSFFSPLTAPGVQILNIADPENVIPTYTMSFTYPIPISGFRMYCDNESQNCTITITVIGF